ncbi:triose-phosphate isomerase [Saccharobesus litoralis]|uniref:Triosephosphate isomerase n=1 Tax=Saccharobesus litoralis TaxID=2172099 RepID=A0A2S0VS95_9ALTE|nr:triose-phosphate isomerase [Saccharobesus litoralis]AWB67079.1 triose-phosphate isomerase [Saccharobesus litoralis]
MGIRKPVVAANWKMNGNKQLVTDFLKAVADSGASTNIDIVLSPPATLLDFTQTQRDSLCKDVILAAQNMSQLDNGAYTGELSAQLFKDVGCNWVYCGHSERRHKYGESSKLVAKKFIQAKKNGLVPVLCVGETEEERKKGKAFSRLTSQIEAVINLAGKDCFDNAILAYEPVWAIGTGNAASPEIAQEAHKFIRGMVAAMRQECSENIRILYGGSVKPENAKELFSQPDIDGGLIGGASLKPHDFVEICQAAKA